VVKPRAAVAAVVGLRGLRRGVQQDIANATADVAGQRPGEEPGIRMPRR
jgi:hypothetical protein